MAINNKWELKHFTKKTVEQLPAGQCGESANADEESQAINNGHIKLQFPPPLKITSITSLPPARPDKPCVPAATATRTDVEVGDGLHLAVLGDHVDDQRVSHKAEQHDEGEEQRDQPGVHQEGWSQGQRHRAVTRRVPAARWTDGVVH